MPALERGEQQPAAESRGRHRQWRNTVAGAAVLLMLGGVAGCGTTAGGGGKGPSASGTPSPSPTRPPSTEAAAVLKEFVPKVDEDYHTSATGNWVAGEVYATGVPFAVVGYQAATGRKLWTLPLSGEICESSRDASRGLVAVVHRATKDSEALCTRMSLIDLSTGKQVWEKPVPGSVSKGFGLNVNVSESIAAAGWPDGSVAYQTTTAGRQLWQNAPAGCSGPEHHGTNDVYGISFCQDRRFRVERRSPDTGRVEWTYTLPRGPRAAYIVSASPLVVATSHGEDYDVDGPDTLTSFTSQGKVQATIDLGKRKYETGCDDDGTCDAIVVAHDTIYLATHAKNFRTQNALTAFDVRSGARKWSSPAPDAGGNFVPVRAESGEPMAYQEPTPLKGAKLFRFDPATGRQSLVLRMPPVDMSGDNDSRDLVRADGRDPALYSHGRLYLHFSGIYWPEETGKSLMSAIYAPKPNA
ncbi:PQQ-binding-like beta-propeller repeat protein [Streptomyces sp. NPDC048442]|uniref:outer membrane protein assembly factor BamB family protein n=1 Tax=Streptomyces sp. NPDC048442 TaxID=3154823 RepID=UPI00343B0E7C